MDIDRPLQTGQHSSWRAFWKILTSFDRSKMAPYMAFRNAAGMLLTLAVGATTHVAFGGPAAACGALFVSYSDGSDPYRHRAFRMIAASVTIAFAAFVGGMSHQYRFGVGVVAAAAAFVVGMAAAFGETALNVGSVSLVMLTIFSGQQLARESLLEAALLALLGGDLSKQPCLSLSGRCGGTSRRGAHWRCCTWNVDAPPRSPLNRATHRRRACTRRKRRELCGDCHRTAATRACGASHS